MSAFFWAAFGSLATEVVSAHQAYQNQSAELPARYRKVGFWLVRLAIAGIAGGLAVAYGIDKAVLAFNIGAACPLIIQKLASSSLSTTTEEAASSEPVDNGPTPENKNSIQRRSQPRLQHLP